MAATFTFSTGLSSKLRKALPKIPLLRDTIEQDFPQGLCGD